MNIYRDEPLSNRDGNDGAEICCKLFRSNCSLNQCSTQFDVETAIKIALIQQFLWRRSAQKEKFAKYNHYTHSQVTQHKCRMNSAFWSTTPCSPSKMADERAKQETSLKWTESRFLKVIAVNVVESGQLRQRFVK
jgi:hypothetical protein